MTPSSKPARESEKKKPAKQRLDVLLVERGLAESRQKAQAMLLAGEVRVDGQRHDKPGERIPAECTDRSDIHAISLRQPGWI